MLDPLTIEHMARVADGAPIVVALSGGGDSIALLHMLKALLGTEKLRPLVVDHALREGSAADAAHAHSLAAEAGVSAEVLTLRWPNGVKRGQAAAREARYAILCNRTRELGAKVIAVAHTADDQVETLLMRAASGSSWRGLAGMPSFAPAPVWPEGRSLWLARPLLGARRAALRSDLLGKGAAWIEDPANSNNVFERVRVRARIAELERNGVDMMRLAQMAAHIRPHADRLDAEAGALITGTVAFEGARVATERSAWRALAYVRRRALSVLLTAVSGAAREPAPDAVERLDARMQADAFTGGSLGGAVVGVLPQALQIFRDPGALAGRANGAPALAPLPLSPGRETVWDGRLELRVAEPGWSVVATPDGAELTRDGARRSLAALAAPNYAVWLLRRRVAHLLGKDD